MHLSGLWNNQSDQLNHLTEAANQYSQDKILEFFLLNTVKTTFRMKNLIQRWTQLGSFFQNWGTFFDFRKRAEKASPPSYLRTCFYRATKVAASGFSLQQILCFSWIWYLLLTVALVFVLTPSKTRGAATRAVL